MQLWIFCMISIEEVTTQTLVIILFMDIIV